MGFWPPLISVRYLIHTHFSISSISLFSIDSSSSVLSRLSLLSLRRHIIGMGVEVVGMVEDGEDPGLEACDEEICRSAGMVSFRFLGRRNGLSVAGLWRNNVKFTHLVQLC